MAKSIVGVDIGYDSLKLALCNRGRVKKYACVPMPQNLIREGRVVSPETLGELIRNTLRDYGIRCKDAALALPNETVFVRNVSMPRMTADQLAYNLPYEFRDYITEEMKDYAFDYAMITTRDELLRQPEPAAEGAEGEAAPGEDGGAGAMELMAVAVPHAVLDEYRGVLRKAGLKLVRIAPSLCAYQELIRDMPDDDALEKEYCILDLGYQAIRMYMFKGDKHIVTRVLEIGMNNIDNVIAESMSVDVHLAHTYLLTNHENCQNADYCLNTYNNIAVELMRAMNFYRFSNPDSQLNDIWLVGGGAVIAPLRAAIAETLDMTVHSADELVDGGDELEDCNALVQAVGITLE